MIDKSTTLPRNVKKGACNGIAAEETESRSGGESEQNTGATDHKSRV